MEERRYSSWLLERVSIGETVRLRLGISTIGRHSSSAIRISNSQYASRHHAEIVVSNDDLGVTIKDLNSINGIFVNERHYSNVTVNILSGDLIGIGVSVHGPNEEDEIQLPIYELKYAPIRRVRQAQPPQPPQPPPAPVHVVEDVVIKQAPNKKEEKEKDNKPNDNDDMPTCSRYCNKIPRPPINVSDEIVEISDNDDDDAQSMAAKSNVVSKPQQQLEFNENVPKSITNQKAIIDKTHSIDDSGELKTTSDNQIRLIDDAPANIEAMVKNEKTDQQDCISSTSSSKNSNLDAADVLNSSLITEISNLNEKQLLQDTPDLINPCQITDFSKSNEQHKDDISNKNEMELHVPILSSLKKELIRSVSADIQNIFGEIAKDDDDVVQNKLKEMNPLVYNELNGKPLIPAANVEKSLHNGDCISLIDDDEDIEEEDLGTIIPIIEENHEKNLSTSEMCKSPNIFDISVNDSKKESAVINKIDNLKEVLNANKTTLNTSDNIDLAEYCNYVPHSDDEDNEDLIFSQVFINDMKAELQDDLEKEPALPQPDSDQDLLPSIVLEDIQIKKEPGLEVSLLSVPKELQNSSWTISDDEDYDEELETKVNDWSNKIFSQSFSNLSQVYDLNTPDIDDDDDYDEDDDSVLEDDLNGLDDIDTMADFYNSNIEDVQQTENKQKTVATDIFLDIDKSVKNLSHEIITAQQSFLESKTIVNTVEESTTEKLTKENGLVNKEIIDCDRNKEKSPDIPDNINESETLSESPIIRKRSLSKNRPAILSSSSSEDEQEIEKDQTEIVSKTNNQLLKGNNSVCSVQGKPLATTATRLPPPVIDAPSLPKHKGKLRGVSADATQYSATSSKNHLKSPGTYTAKALSSTKSKIIQERINNDLKRKWCEKPSMSKKRDKEQKKIIKECRKDKLKELAEKQKIPTEETNNKRKLSTECHMHQSKKSKVKVTAHNRGAFLAEKETKLPPPPSPNKTDNNHFKIPKVINKKPGSVQKEPQEHKRSNSVDCMETFSQQLTKPDELLLKHKSTDTSKKQEQQPHGNCSNNPTVPPTRRHSLNEQPKQTLSIPAFHNFIKPAVPTPSPICKEAVAARAVRTTNKITFASMEKNIIESEENKRKLNKLSSVTLISNMKKVSSSMKKKTVRFNDTPVIHYIERVSGASRKVVYKDIMPLTTNKDRRQMVRRTYPIIDCTDTIISNILCWSNEWLIKRNAAAEAASDVIFPMPQQFNSFEHYKSILFPLMKIEFVSLLERDFISTTNIQKFKVSLEYVTANKDRFMLVTKFNSQTRAQQDSSLYDFVILESDVRGPQIFAYVTANRKGAGSTSTIVYEIIAKNFTKEYFKSVKEFYVRPVVDNVRVNFGAFNAVHQLEATPLFHKIINPLELLNARAPPKKKIEYRGCDRLNDKQRQVLLNTYIQIIDESTPNITLLQGPPGTGKSCVITNMALQTLYGNEVRYLDKKILICAQSNAAVDVIAGKLFAISLKMRAEIRFRLIRFGKLNKIQSDVLPIALQNLVERDQLKKVQAKNKDIEGENKENLKNQILQLEAQIANLSTRNIKGTVEYDDLLEKQRQLKLLRSILNQSMRPEDERSLYSWYLNNANIICATLSSCINLFQYVNYFDICIIDEATQCTEPWTLLPLKFGINSLVLVGDTQQLPATVISKKASALGLGTSLFTRIQHCLDNIPCTSAKVSSNVTTPKNIICGLQTQYRMHPDICKWPNQYFYRNELINGQITMEFKSSIVPFSILNLAYTQNSTCINGKITNNLEAEFVAKLLKALDGFIPNKYNSYGVITPYAHHRATLESSIRSLGLTNIMVNTIDSYQGLEKDVIIISNARTNGIGFLSNPQRLNVALTRPKKCLILCGNFKNLETVPAWRCLLESARERKVFHEISANCVEDIQRNVIDKIKIKK